jgi:hypothetical protein
MHIAVAGRVAYIRTFDPSGKVRRICRTAQVENAPPTVRGRVTGAPREQGVGRFDELARLSANFSLGTVRHVEHSAVVGSYSYALLGTVRRCCSCWVELPRRLLSGRSGSIWG